MEIVDWTNLDDLIVSKIVIVTKYKGKYLILYLLSDDIDILYNREYLLIRFEDLYAYDDKKYPMNKLNRLFNIESTYNVNGHAIFAYDNKSENIIFINESNSEIDFLPIEEYNHIYNTDILSELDFHLDKVYRSRVCLMDKYLEKIYGLFYYNSELHILLKYDFSDEIILIKFNYFESTISDFILRYNLDTHFPENMNLRVIDIHDRLVVYDNEYYYYFNSLSSVGDLKGNSFRTIVRQKFDSKYNLEIINLRIIENELL